MTTTFTPLPVPPRTPTPPPDDSAAMEANALNPQDLNGILSPTKGSFAPTTLSPMQENFAYGRRGSRDLLSSSSSNPPLSAASINSVYSAMSAESGGTMMTTSTTSEGADEVRSPFNFQPMVIAKSPVTKSSVGQRRGHKYKHSSVSHQIFLEPAPRPPPSVPTSLPVPTLAECRRSMSRDQRTRFAWCICHMLIAAHTLWSAAGSLAQTALSHLILFDSLGALLCVVVDVLANFEVWRRSSIRHPFGIERAEVLAGFAMSVLLLFMGLDLISHNLQHVLEAQGGHAPHHVHAHDAARVRDGGLDAASLLAIVSTVVSAFGLKNHARIGKVMRFAYIETLPGILSNPSHFLTITCSSLLLLLPLLSIQMYVWLDRALSSTVALSMCLLGSRLVHALGLMLLMSYSGKDGGAGAVQTVLRDIESDPSVAAIEEARFWQVHYGLCMGNLTVRVRGTEDGLARLRERIVSLVRTRLGGGYGGGSGTKWEVNAQFVDDRR